MAEGYQLDEATYRDVIYSLLDKFYADMKMPPRQNSHSGELEIKPPGTRVWTRGDGTRHRDPGYITASYFASDKKQAEKLATKFWPWLLKQPGVKSIGQVSGEFGSSPMKDAVAYKGLYFTGGQYGVQFGSLSRIKNPKSVWRHQPPATTQPQDEQGVAENEIPGHSMGFTGGVGPGTLDNMIDEMPIEFNKENPIQSQINHKSNPGSIEYRIMRARSQIKDLATRVDSNELVVWESITRQFPELAMNIEEIRHGIEELAKIRKGGGRRSHNIDKHIGEAVMPAIKATTPTTPKTVKPKAKTSVCKAGQVQTGMQVKNGKSVPKCSVR